MDDLLTGANSLEEAIQKRQLIHSTLMSVQFPLRKYVSNLLEFLSLLNSSLIAELRPIEFLSLALQGF